MNTSCFAIELKRSESVSLSALDKTGSELAVRAEYSGESLPQFASRIDEDSKGIREPTKRFRLHILMEIQTGLLDSVSQTG
jgi:hypothetical protein